MTGRVEGKVAFVTGAAQGLGQAMAMMFARHGAKVALTDINGLGLEAAVAEINAELPGAAIGFEHDVTDEARWQEVLDDTVTRFGGLHILVNNAGVASTQSVEDETYENWRKVHAIDLDSVFFGCKYAIPHIRSSGGGSIINISSISGIIAGHNLAAYNSAKAAVRHFTKSVALHCARRRYNIRCNSIHPVFVATPILDGLTGSMSREEAHEKLGRQVPLGRIGEPDDIAYGALYLASDESKFMTGAELKIDGGISAM